MNVVGPYTQQMAAFAAAYRYEALPPQAVAQAKEIVLDTIGAILLGSRPDYKSVWTLGDQARADGGPAQCTVFGRDFKAPLLSAILANGTMGYAADAEGAGAARMHAGAVFVPTVLTVGEYAHASGKKLIAALALAYDVACRVSDAADPGTPYPHSFHPSAVFGHFGAAAAASHFFDLDERQWVNALGLAGINAGGLIAWVDDPTEDSRGFVIGVAAQSGTRAALLAQKGMGGPVRILDDTKYSIYDAYAGAMHLERLAKGLGTEYRILEADGYKPYPCCGDIHSGLDALLSLRQKHAIRAEEIAGITHWVKPVRHKVIDNNPLKSHNAQYILAVAATNGTIDPNDILVDRRADPAIADLYRRTQLLPEPTLSEITNNAPAIVEVRLRDGRTFKERVNYRKGSSQNPFTAEELREKFLRWATTRIPKEQARRIVALTERLEELRDVGELVGLMASR
ncbi:MAG: MmgE/PrpD family protein [Anaerolineae bacterium]|nr:MmgE/PrpD family protein [Anaerolineae bacterium]